MKWDIRYYLTPRYIKWLLLALSLIFLSLIIFEIYALLTFKKHLAAEVKVSTNMLPANANKQTGKIKYSALFGAYVPEDIHAASIKQSLLNVKLVGILYAESLEDSQVIIQSADGEARIYSLNESIPGGAVVKRIMPDAILLEHNGGLERLSLPKHALEFEPAAKPLIED